MKKYFLAATLALFSMAIFASPVKNNENPNKVSLINFTNKENRISKSLDKKISSFKEKKPVPCTVSTTISYTYSDGTKGSATFSSTSNSGCGAANSNVQAAVSVFFQLCSCA